MKNLSSMSRAELVCELMAAPFPAMVSDALGAYEKSCESPCQSPCDALVCRKLFIAKEVILRDLSDRMKSSPILISPQVARDWLKVRYGSTEYELFIVLHLDAQHRLIEAEEMFRGTLTQTSVYPREVVKSALTHNAAAVILAHNHPSGNTAPSNADRALTECLRSALALVDVRIIDHLIVAADNVLSFAEQGFL